MKLLKLITFFAVALSATILPAQKYKVTKTIILPLSVKNINVRSEARNKDVNAFVVLPDDYDKNKDKRYPVIYLLHGLGDNHTTWVVKTKPNLDRVATEHQVIFVCPDGSTSWYWDAPKNPAFKYETFVSKELVEYIDKNYRTIANKNGRAITGFSMGGHGGLWLGFRHPDVFGSCGSMSGGVDFRPFQLIARTAELLGDYASNEKVWDSHTVINQLNKLNAKNMPAIIIDCGTSDFLYEVNEALHKKMLYMKIPHEYITRPGGHSHKYWRDAIDNHIMFFLKRFPKQ